ncbi:glycosyltransferase family 4 protein [Thermomonas fusca]
MAKYLFYLPRFHTNVVPWVRLLRQAGHQPAVHVSYEGPTEDRNSLVPVAVAPSSFFKRNEKSPPIDRVPSFRAVWRGMANERPDVVIVRGISRALSRVALICALFQRRRIVIYDQEDVVPERFSTWLRRAVFRSLGIPHITTRLPIGPLKRTFGEAIPVPFANPWVSVSGFRDEYAGVAILMVAKYRRRKGHSALIAALARLKDEFDFRVTLCGEEASPEDVAFCGEICRQSEVLGISDRVVIRNNVPHKDMRHLYVAHDIFILPSLNEPAAVSPIEAAWSGCAVLVSSDTGTRGYVPPGRAFDFDARDPIDVARCLAGAMDSPDSLRRMKDACLNHIRSVADDPLIIDKFEILAGVK